MKKVLLSLLLFTVAFAVFLIATVPAKYALSFLPANTPVQLSGVSGTIWNGQAASLRQQQTDLGKLEWSLKPLSLITMKLAVDFRLSKQGLLAEGEATVHKDQTIELSSTELKGDVGALPLPEDKMLATPAGRFNADIEHALLKGQTIIEANADILWKPARITAPSEYDLGEISLDIEGKDSNISGKLGSKKSPVNLSGTVLLDKNGFLNSNIKLSPHAQTPAEIRDMLPLAGKPARDGSITIKQRIRLR